MMRCEEIQELLTAYVDGEVTSGDQAIVEDHIRSCTSCTRSVNVERFLKALVHEKGQSTPLPHDFLGQSATVLLQEHRYSALRGVWNWLRSKPAPLYALAATAFVLVFLWYSTLFHRSSLIDEAVSTHQRMVAREIPLQISTRDASRLSTDLAARTWLRPNPMVYSLESTGFHLQGGSIIRISEKPTIYTLYKDDEHLISCFRLKASPEMIPQADEEIPFDSRPLRVFRQGGVNVLVTWENESDLCIRVSSLPVETLVRIAGATSPR